MNNYSFTVTAKSQFLLEQSDLRKHQYAFAYTVTIQNTGSVAAQLISRYWLITDSNGHAQEISGLGIVGHQPLLASGEQFEYSSWAVIDTPVGTMQGHYFCVAEDGTRFESPIPEFTLAVTSRLH
jgi:ApaG protein